jgi:hypothetical protein
MEKLEINKITVRAQTVNEEFDYIKGIKLKLRVIILDVIFYGEQVTTLPFSDRIKIINSININKFNLLQIPVSINVRTQSEFVVIVNDLINDKNGRLFDPKDIDSFIRLIKQTRQQIVKIKKQRDSIGEQAHNKFSIKKSAKAFIDTIEELDSKQMKV